MDFVMGNIRKGVHGLCRSSSFCRYQDKLCPRGPLKVAGKEKWFITVIDNTSIADHTTFGFVGYFCSRNLSGNRAKMPLQNARYPRTKPHRAVFV